MAVSSFKGSVGVRILVILVLIILLLIPLGMISALIQERKFRRESTLVEITQKWGSQQTITGPILTVPYIKTHKDAQGNVSKIRHNLHILPDQLNIQGEIVPEVRYRGIYEIVVYNAKLKIEGVFPEYDLKERDISRKEVVWEDVHLSVGITDLTGINEAIKIFWNDDVYPVSSGIPVQENLSSGVSSKIEMRSLDEPNEFSMELSLNGSKQLFFVPLGKTTTVKLSSNWGDPSFIGAFLPDHREIEKDRFSASWKVFNLNRNFPQSWIGSYARLANSAFGVELIMLVDHYQKTSRTVKYAIMFLCLTFLCFFMIELLGDSAIHPVQYLLIGLGLVLFYSLLLSISEHLLFKYAYLIGSLSMILMISGYTRSFLRNKKFSLAITGLLIVLYTYLYILVQLQDYALLLGNIGLFIILGIVMYLTKNIDWFSVFKSKKQ